MWPLIGGERTIHRGDQHLSRAERAVVLTALDSMGALEARPAGRPRRRITRKRR